jgi:hypothetical protein
MKTKKARLEAIIDRYVERKGVRGMTVGKVADFAMANRLWPVPGRGDALACAIWERMLKRAR